MFKHFLYEFLFIFLGYIYCKLALKKRKGLKKFVLLFILLKKAQELKISKAIRRPSVVLIFLITNKLKTTMSCVINV